MAYGAGVTDAHERAAAAPWWTTLPTRRVVYLADAATGAPIEPDLLAIDLDPLPESAPAVLRFRPATGGPLGDQVAVLLKELERAAVALFPAWLPGAEQLSGPEG